MNYEWVRISVCQWDNMDKSKIKSVLHNGFVILMLLINRYRETYIRIILDDTLDCVHLSFLYQYNVMVLISLSISQMQLQYIANCSCIVLPIKTCTFSKIINKAVVSILNCVNLFMLLCGIFFKLF